MNTLVAWFAHNRVAANLLMVLIIVLGLLAIPQTRKELIPNVSLDLVNIIINYPGATPSEVESSILVRVEEKLNDLEGIRKLTSRAVENTAIISVEVEPAYNTRELLNDVKTRVDAIDTFPADIEKPVISEISIRNRVANVVISGNTTELILKKHAERVRDELTALPSITQVELHSVRPYEISIELSEHNLQRYNLTFDEVAKAVRLSSLDLPAGVLKTTSGDVMLRTQGQVYEGEQFEKIVLRAHQDGSRILLSDVARVVDGFAEQDLYSKFNGQASVSLTVYRVGEQNILDIANEIKDYIKSKPLPAGLNINIWQDRSEYFKGRLGLLLRNAVTGLILVFIILVLFLRMRLAFWVVLGIPISFLGALWLLPTLGGSINMISMFAFILVLGIVVDDAIIVGESIYAEHNRGHYGLNGAIRGVRKVAMPVVFAVLTSVVAFMPLLFLPGPEGRLWLVIPLVVIATLLFSLLECLLILPAHLSTIEHKKQLNRFKATQLLQAFSDWLERFIEYRYRPFIEFALRWRYAVATFFVALLIVFISIIASGWLSLVFFPNIGGDFANASVRFSQGSPLIQTENALKNIENSALQLQKELQQETGQQEITAIMTTAGAQPISRGSTGTHVGEVSIELGRAEDRIVSVEQVTQRWRKKVGEIPGAIELKFESSLRNNGPGIQLDLAGIDLKKLKQASLALKSKLKQYSGLYEIQDSFDIGKREVRLKLKQKAHDLSINSNDLARQVRQAFYGEEIQRIQRGRDDVKVFVRYPKHERQSLYFLENMRIRVADGTEIPLLDIADLTYSNGPSEIKRSDRRRIITVSAFVDESITHSSEIMQDLQPQFLDNLTQNFPGIYWSLSGKQKEQQELVENLAGGFIIALLGIYILMAIPFHSYTQPIMVMTAIPFGLIGAVIGHILLGLEISLLSLCGMIAVSGVVVNDNLVLVEYINRLRNNGVKLADAIRNAGAERFRPILLTSLTTFAGLTPLMLEQSVQAQFLIPMGVSLAFGVMFATSITLILIPISYHILDDFHQLFYSSKNINKNLAVTTNTPYQLDDHS